MNRKEAEDYVYQSYLKAQKEWSYDTPDSLKRHPGLSKEIIRSLSRTPAVVVTGSKGKGSVASMIAKILPFNSVGLMTSPHIKDFLERFRVNGELISENDFIRGISVIKPRFDELEKNLPKEICISPIGIQTALALNYFNERATDFNIFECGKGAKYDDVNNVAHKYAVINSIFMEHKRELGNTIEEIAEDKCHVITGEQECIFVGKQKPEVLEIIKRRAKEFNVPVKAYGRDFKSENICYTVKGMKFDVMIGDKTYPDIFLPLLGEHQAENCALALAFCQEVSLLDIENVRSRLATMIWPGRMQIISSNPFILLDACINGESSGNVKNTLKFLGIAGITLIVGIPDDKDYMSVVLSMKNLANKIILTGSRNPHYKFTPIQERELTCKGVKTIRKETVEQSIEFALELGRPIVILGTTSVVSEVISYFDK